MRQDKALKILSDNLEDIKREFGVKSIGVFPWRESPPMRLQLRLRLLPAARQRDRRRRQIYART